MKLGVSIGHAGADLDTVVPVVQHAENIGMDSVWVSEGWGPDAISVIGYLAARTSRIDLAAAVLQMAGRTPAATATAALTLDAISGGRLILGLGLSGPQVTEGWHGVPFAKPLTFTREYVEIVRQVLRHESVAYDGSLFQLPYRGPGSTGLGKSLRTSVKPVRGTIPVFLGALGPQNVALAAEIADGWYPTFYSPERDEVFAGALQAGFERAGRDSSSLEVAALVKVAVCEDIEACRDALRDDFALVLGGYGAIGQNFYLQLMERYGLSAALQPVQDLFMAGHKREAAAAVPDWFIDEFALVGPRERIRDRLDAWKSSRVGTIVLRTLDPEALSVVRELVS